MGHLEATAGGAGTISLLATALRTGGVVPNVQLRQLNPHLNSLVRSVPLWLPVNTALPVAWQEWHGRISSFGATGTIAHALFHREMVRAPGS